MYLLCKYIYVNLGLDYQFRIIAESLHFLHLSQSVSLLVILLFIYVLKFNLGYFQLSVFLVTGGFPTKPDRYLDSTEKLLEGQGHIMDSLKLRSNQ